MARALVKVPATAKPGEIVAIRAMVAHPMETGYRRTQLGEPVPRDIVTRFTCTYDDVEIFSAELHPAIAANPFLVFHVRAVKSGTLRFQWTGDNGFSVTESAPLVVA